MDLAPRLVGYLDRMSFRPGEVLTLFASGAATDVAVDLVRLRRGPDMRGDRPTPLEPVAWEGAGTVAVTPQESCVGSFVAARAAASVEPGRGYSVGGWFQPTLPHRDGAQTLAAWDGGAITLVAGRVQAELAGRSPLVSRVPLTARAWVFVQLAVAGDHARLDVIGADPLYSASGFDEAAGAVAARVVRGDVVSFGAVPKDAPVTRAGYARGRSARGFEGKIAYPFVCHRALSPQARGRDELIEVVNGDGGSLWDLAPQRTGASRWSAPLLAGAGDPAVLVNQPTQGVTGPDWDGSAVSFRERGDQYSAVHVHSTDLVDAGWAPTLSAPLPAELPSGVYGLRLRSDGGDLDVIPFVVTPAPGGPRARLLVVMPTFTYLAYANEDLISFFSEIDVHVLHEEAVLDIVRDRQVYHGREFGASLYDRHPDGSGVHFSSSLRPILDMRPDYRFWAYETGTRSFAADLYLIEWLDRFGYDVDVVTDLELHLEGAASLAGYEAVLTGSHPEYHSGQILDAFTAYRDRGGKIAYLGGNGFYWVTGVVNEDAPVIEIRRGHVGIRTWESAPGEVDLVSSWEPGGLWRFRGRAPQRLVGVGMAAQGGDSRPYRLSSDEVRSTHPWFTRGLEGDLIGERGWVGGAAAGDEFDRVDARLGTPPGTVVLAASGEHPIDAQRAAEELLQMFHGSASGPNDPEIHADMTYFETPTGGAVFSASAIAFIASLPVDEGRNSSSVVLRNVLDHFLGAH